MAYRISLLFSDISLFSDIINKRRRIYANPPARGENQFFKRNIHGVYTDYVIDLDIRDGKKKGIIQWTW